MLKNAYITFPLVVAFMLTACGGEQVGEGEAQFPGATSDNRSCRDVYLEDVVGKNRNPDVEDYYIIRKNERTNTVETACRFVENKENNTIMYQEFRLANMDICKGAIEPKYPFSCIYSLGQSEGERASVKEADRILNSKLER